MKSNLSKIVYEAGQRLVASNSDLAEALNNNLNQLLKWPFRAATGFIEDFEGQKTDVFGTLIYTTSQSQPLTDSANYKADNVACVIDVYRSINVEQLRFAYERIACAKRLKKTPMPDTPGIPTTNITLGIIFAFDSVVPIEALAEEIDRLNRQHPNREWTDMVTILPKGIINYAVQFPGAGISGDYLPPAEGALKLFTPPMYITLIVRPTGQFSFNKMLYFIVGHLNIFSPGARLPNYNKILEGTPNNGMVITGYQYNLSGDLMPVPRQFYSDRYIPPRPYLIKNKEGDILATLSFIPWQDGGVILLKGKYPLDTMLIMLGEKALKRGGIVKQNGLQISYVLPITRENFLQMLQRIQNELKLIVKLEPSKFVIQKISDEGTRSPFIARLHVGIMNLRDMVFPDDVLRKKFDEPYEKIIETLLNARRTSQNISQIINNHINKLTEGQIGYLRGNSIQITETIDSELRREAETFVNSSVRVLKYGMQEITKILGIDIGFLFKKQNSFEKEIEILKKDEPLLAIYLKEARKWSEQLLDVRNDIEHKGWSLPKMRYHESSGIIKAEEPAVAGQKVTEFTKFILDRLICFVEEVITHCLKEKMPESITVTEIPLSSRKVDIPKRFEITLVNGGLPVWNIAYHQCSFEEN